MMSSSSVRSTFSLDVSLRGTNCPAGGGPGGYVAAIKAAQLGLKARNFSDASGNHHHPANDEFNRRLVLRNVELSEVPA